MSGSFWQSFLTTLEELKKQNPIYYSILSDLDVLEVSDDTVVFGCGSVGAKNYMQKKQNDFEGELSEFIKKNVSVVFVLREEKKQKKTPLLNYEPTKNDVVRAAGLRTNFTFESFAVSPTNQVAFAAAQAVSKQPGSSYNPLFIYGGVGVGKTHLAQATARAVLLENPDIGVFFCSGERFMNELIESIRTKTTPKFRKKYRGLNLIVVDDIQFIAGKRTVQEEFFHTFNSVVSSGGQIILTSDRPPHEIKNLEDRLRSRFSGGLIVDIQNPDFELRTAILLIKAREKNIDIGIDAAKKIAENVMDARALEGSLLTLYARTVDAGSEISLPSVERFLFQKKERRPKTSPQEAIKAVCSFYNIKPTQIKDKTRKSNIAFARQIAMFVLRTEMGLGFEEIARLLKRKDHTTVMYGVNKIKGILMKDTAIKEDVFAITSSLFPST
ncbi:chromosomal replication initiator protein DnaA [Candidatus Woesebacteria bacterium]|nr:chromosomal replication initiator protein DnaA [Candidatus Woesebacteria bacterium]